MYDTFEGMAKPGEDDVDLAGKTAASYFETRLKEILTNFVEKKSSNDSLLTNLVKNKVLERNYHTFFNWEAKNANVFFSIFGEEFKHNACADVNSNEDLKKSIIDFLDLGNNRNKLAHQNFAHINMDKTAEEVYSQYRSALMFIKYIEKKLNV